MNQKYILFAIFMPILVVPLLSLVIQLAFGQEEVPEFLNRRVAVWQLFYKLMVSAFIVGAVVTGVIFYVCFRYSENNKHNKFPATKEDAKH